MKVVMVISQFHPIIGGAEKQAQLLAKKLIEKGIDVHVATGWWNFGTPRKERIDGISVTRNFALWSVPGIKRIRFFRFLRALAYMVSLGTYLLSHRKEYDLIHVHQVLYPAFVSVFVGRGFLHKPVLAKNACSGLTSDIRNIKKFPLGGLQLRYLVKHMDCLVAVNTEGAEEFKAIGYPGTKIVSISNGVAIPANGKVQYGSVRNVLTAVRLDAQKGLDVLLKAWTEVVQREKGVRLVILGKGPLESKLKRLSESLAIAGSVEFRGVVSNIEDDLKETDLFVLPSRAEGLSNALLEAMSYGVPCVSTPVGGHEELFESGGKKILSGEYLVAKNGVLVNPDDVVGLSRAMVDLIRNRTERETLGRNGRKAVQTNYSIDSIAERYLVLYQDLLKEKP